MITTKKMGTMRIIPFDMKCLTYFVKLFVEEYAHLRDSWDTKHAKKYLLNSVERCPEYCFMALDTKGNLMGGVFCRTGVCYNGEYLFIDSLYVKKEYRRRHVAKELMRKIIDTCRKNSISGVQFSAPGWKRFPRSWYRKLGFQPSGWVEYEARLSEITI